VWTICPGPCPLIWLKVSSFSGRNYKNNKRTLMLHNNSYLKSGTERTEVWCHLPTVACVLCVSIQQIITRYSTWKVNPIHEFTFTYCQGISQPPSGGVNLSIEI
jgi:hypothetical protein